MVYQVYSVQYQDDVLCEVQVGMYSCSYSSDDEMRMKEEFNFRTLNTQSSAIVILNNLQRKVFLYAF
jgi:hypothetical protein